MINVDEFLCGEVKDTIEKGDLQDAVSKMFTLLEYDIDDVENVLYSYFCDGGSIKRIIKDDDLEVFGEIDEIKDIDDDKFYMCVEINGLMVVENINKNKVWVCWYAIYESV
jgi:hypothetical protein